MKTYSSLIFAIAYFLLLPLQIQAQTEPDTTQLWRIELTNENEYIGTIVSRDPEKIVFNSQELGVITIDVRNIRRIEEISGSRMIGGEYWFENPQATRYFWAPTGYGLKKGEGYYQNVWIFFNQFSFGITDNTSVGVGLVPAFLFGGAPTPIWITPKFSLPVQEKLAFGGGALIGTILGEDGGGAYGIAYGTMTVGTKDRNLNLGVGYGYAGRDWANSPTITLSGMLRTGRRGYLLTENYFISTGSETLAIISLGGRTIAKKISIDYGGFLPISTEIDTFFVLPWLGIVVPFGNAQQRVQPVTR